MGGCAAALDSGINVVSVVGKAPQQKSGLCCCDCVVLLMILTYGDWYGSLVVEVNWYNRSRWVGLIVWGCCCGREN